MISPTRPTAPGLRTDQCDCRRRVRGQAAVLCTAVAALALATISLHAQEPPAAATGLATTRAAATSISSDRLLILVATLTGEGTPAERKQAALEIIQAGTEDSVRALAGVLGLKNNNPAKLAICEALGEVDSAPVGLADPLLAILDQRKDGQLRDAVVAALYRFTDTSVSKRLRGVLEREELAWLRTEHVARSRELYNLLTRDVDRTVRLQAWLKAAQPLDRLSALEIVHGAMLATVPQPPVKEVLQQIRQMVHDPDENVRRALVTVLRDLQEKEDAGRILAMLDHERSTAVQEEIYKALGRMGDPDSVAACIKGLQSPVASVAAGAADALGRLCRKTNATPSAQAGAAVTALLLKASRPVADPVLRAQLLGAMAEIADPSFLPVFIAHAGNDEKVPQIRQAALTGIGNAGETTQIDLVISRLAEDPDLGVRDAAAEALGKLGNKVDHLRPLALRLSEAAQPVQNRAWEAYRRVFGRIPWADRLQILATWTGKDKFVLSRRIDLLSDLEAAATTAKSEALQLLWIREELGDALLATMEYALAAGAYTRALESVAADQLEPRIALTGKLLDAYLHVPAYDKAIAVVRSAKSAQMSTALAERLLAHAQELAKADPKAVQDCLDRFKAATPALFAGEWGARFEEARRAASQPATVTAG